MGHGRRGSKATPGMAEDMAMVLGDGLAVAIPHARASSSGVLLAVWAELTTTPR